MDMTGANASYAGFWVHNGIATGASAGASAEARGASPATDLGRDATEPDLVDDDADGAVDDEDWVRPARPATSTSRSHSAVRSASCSEVLPGAPGQKRERRHA